MAVAYARQGPGSYVPVAPSSYVPLPPGSQGQGSYVPGMPAPGSYVPAPGSYVPPPGIQVTASVSSQSQMWLSAQSTVAFGSHVPAVHAAHAAHAAEFATPSQLQGQAGQAPASGATTARVPRAGSGDAAGGTLGLGSALGPAPRFSHKPRSATLDQPPTTVTHHAYYMKPVEFNEQGRVVRSFGGNSLGWISKLMSDVIGKFHVGIQVGDKDEYTFGNYHGVHQRRLGSELSGVFRHDPKMPGPQCEFAASTLLGKTKLTRGQVEAILEEISDDYSRASYQMIRHNCHDFCAEFAKRLNVSEPPAWSRRGVDAAEFLGFRQAQGRQDEEKDADVSKEGHGPTNLSAPLSSADDSRQSSNLLVPRTNGHFRGSSGSHTSPGRGRDAMSGPVVPRSDSLEMPRSSLQDTLLMSSSQFSGKLSAGRTQARSRTLSPPSPDRDRTGGLSGLPAPSAPSKAASTIQPSVPARAVPPSQYSPSMMHGYMPPWAPAHGATSASAFVSVAQSSAWPSYAQDRAHPYGKVLMPQLAVSPSNPWLAPGPPGKAPSLSSVMLRHAEAPMGPAMGMPQNQFTWMNGAYPQQMSHSAGYMSSPQPLQRVSEAGSWHSRANSSLAPQPVGPPMMLQGISSAAATTSSWLTPCNSRSSVPLGLRDLNATWR